MTLHMGAAGSPAAARAMAAYLLERQVPVEAVRSAAYYARTDHVDEALQAGHGGAPVLRADMAPELAEALGLVAGAPIDEAALGNVLAGNRADGAPLPVAHAGITTYGGEDGDGPVRHRVAYVDLTFSAPKDVSLAWAFAETDAERNSILQAHRTATAEAIAYIEKNTLRARMGKGGESGIEAGRIATIAVGHYTARPTREQVRTDPKTGEVYTELTSDKVAGDPALHTHVLVPNLMLTESGRMAAIDMTAMHGRVHESGAVYQAVLGRELRTLGAEVAYDARTNAVRLPVIPEAAIEEFSKRTRDGEREARRRAEAEGLDWDTLSPESRATFAKVGTHATRLDKETNIPDWQAWGAQAERIGWSHKTVLGGAGSELRPPEMRMSQADASGLVHLSEMLGKRAVIGQGDARLAAARGFIEHGIGHTDEIGEMMRRWAHGQVHQQGQWTTLIWDEVERGKIRMTTGLHRDQEQELIGLARSAADDTRHSLSSGEIAAGIRRTGVRYEGAAGVQQRAAVDALGSDGSLGVMIGVAGAGKTFGVLPPLVSAWQERSLTVWGVAQAWRQARDMGGTGIRRAHTRALQPFLDGVADGRTKLDGNVVVVVDEVGQVGTRQMLELLRLRAEHGFKLVTLGDDKQSQAIEAGAVLGLLRKAVGDDRVPQILETVRQSVETERAIASLFRNGKAGEAIERKREQGTAELVAGGYREAVSRVADLYAERRAATSGRADYRITISAPTNVDAREIAREVRERRRAMGEVGADVITVSSTDGRGGGGSLPLAVGDNVRLFAQTRGVFTNGAGRRTAGAVVGDNGTVLRIEAIAPGDGLTVRTVNGKQAFVAWTALRDRTGSGRLLLAHGDVLTIDSSQGITSDEHINAMPAGSASVTGFKAYVAESRHRQHSWLVGSMGAEMREVRTRRMSGLPPPSPAEETKEAWENMARNLTRQPTKESALAFLGAAAVRRHESAKMLQAGLRRHQAREARGETATTVATASATAVVRDMLPRIEAGLAAVAEMQGQVAQGVAAMRLAPASPDPATAASPGAGAPAATPSAPRARPRTAAPAVEAPAESTPPPTAPAEAPAIPAKTPRKATPATPRAERVKISETEAQMQFAEAMRLHGLRPPGLPIMDGQLHYVPVEGNKSREKAGAYKGFYEGIRPSGTIYNYKLGGWMQNWKADGEVVAMSDAERAEMVRAAAAATAARDAARVAREDAGAAVAQSLIAGAARADGSHPYLRDKGVDALGLYVGVRGQAVTVQAADGSLRQHSVAGRLLVPLVDGKGVIRNVQTIAADGTKLYLSGAQKIGTFHTIGVERPGEPVGVAEGYATAASAHAATGLAVRMALDTSNLGAVAQDVRARDAGRVIYMVADNDHHLPLRVPAPGREPLANAGREKAEAVAREVGAVVLLPPALDARAAIDKGTDWNDYEKHAGRAAVAGALLAQMAATRAEAVSPAPRPAQGA